MAKTLYKITFLNAARSTSCTRARAQHAVGIHRDRRTGVRRARRRVSIPPRNACATNSATPACCTCRCRASCASRKSRERPVGDPRRATAKRGDVPFHAVGHQRGTILRSTGAVGASPPVSSARPARAIGARRRALRRRWRPPCSSSPRRWPRQAGFAVAGLAAVRRVLRRVQHDVRLRCRSAWIDLPLGV